MSMTTNELSEITGVPVSTLLRWENYALIELLPQTLLEYLETPKTQWKWCRNTVERISTIKELRKAGYRLNDKYELFKLAMKSKKKPRFEISIFDGDLNVR